MSAYLKKQVFDARNKHEDHKPLTMREVVLCLYGDLNQIVGLRPYMRELVENCAARIEQYRAKPDQLDFDHNESIILTRLFVRVNGWNEIVSTSTSMEVDEVLK